LSRTRREFLPGNFSRVIPGVELLDTALPEVENADRNQNNNLSKDP
jgi:hypothetical protein